MKGAGHWAGWWHPWAEIGGFAFLLHFVWEMLQAPFFQGMGGKGHWAAILVCLRATGGDIAITWVAYAAGAMRTGDRHWLGRGPSSSTLIFLGVGLALTAFLEWLNVYRLSRWTYTDTMPMVLGVGLAPLLQWIIVPPLTLWLARRHIEGGVAPSPAA